MSEERPEAGQDAGRVSLAVRVTLALLVVGAFLLRTLPRWDETFGPDGLRLPDPDAWHHLRQIEQWVRHFPARMTWDAYMLHPAGQAVPVAPLFDGIAAAVAWLLGAGSPSETTIQRVAVLLPPALGALTCVPVFALGRRVGGAAGGLLAALVLAFLPGQFLSRSLLGYADHHVLETLLAAVTLACLAASVAAADARRGLRCAAAAGLAVAAHLGAWTGGALLLIAVGACGLAVLVADELKQRDTTQTLRRFLVVCVLAGTVGPLLLGFRQTSALDAAAAAGVAGALAATWLVLRICRRGAVRPGLAVAAALALHAVAAAVATLVIPRAARTVEAALGWFTATAERVTVSEARPLLLDENGVSLAHAWETFGVAGIVAILGAALLAVRIVKKAAREDVVVAVASAGALLLSFAQVRFAAWGALAVAVLVGVALGPWLGRAWRGEARDTPRWLGRGVWPATVAIGLVLPTAPLVWITVTSAGTPNDQWAEALRWLRDETPEPFGDASAFHQILDPEAIDALRRRPGTPAATAVLAWWDYGYWITGIAHRVPLANGTQSGAGDVARVLLERDPARAARELDRLGARWVVLDSDLPVFDRGDAIAGRLPSLLPWAGRDADSLVVRLSEPRGDGTSADVALFLPDYFRSLAVRLHVFGGRAAAATDIRGVAWRDAPGGVKEVVASKTFATWDEADAWARAAPHEHVSIGSLDPSGSCVPLEAAAGFRLAFHSSTAAGLRGFEPIWAVQVWERADE